MGRHAARAPHQQSLGAGESAGHGDGVGVAHHHHLVDHLPVQGLRPEVLADTLDQILTHVVFGLGGEDRALRVDPNHPDLGVLALEIASRPADRAAGADPGHQDAHPSVGLLPDLGAGGLLVRLGVGRVGVLVGVIGAVDLGGEPASHSVVGVGMVGAEIGRGDVDLHPVGPEQRALLFAHLVGDGADHPVAPHRADDGETDPGVPAGWLDDGSPRPEQPETLGAVDHRYRDPLFDRTSDGGHLHLGHQVPWWVEAGEPYQRGPADCLLGALPDIHGGRW